MKTKAYGRLAGGGSSVLVIFLMLLLITLGALALVSSNANLRLAKKGAAWMKDYYLLEASGESIVALVSKSLHQTNEILSANGGPGEESRDSYFARHLSCCLEDTGAALPYGTEITEWKVEPDDNGLVLLTAWLARKHQSGNQCLLVQIQVSGVSDRSTTGSFQVLQWKQYQEPFEYEPEFNILQ